MIGVRLRQARQAAGLSQQALADRVGVSKMAVSKYERDRSMPGSRVLLGLGEVLSVSPDYFFRPPSAALERLDFRKHPRLPQRDEARVLADVRDQLDRWTDLAEVLPAAWSEAFVMPQGLPRKVERLDELEGVADRVRSAWGLGTDPIPDLAETLERRAVKVLESDLIRAPDFDGLAATTDGHRVIVVSAASPGDRQRFTMAHELGHLILVGRLSPELDDEIACNRFAGAFLVPAARAREALGERRRWLEPRELSLLKQEWGLSLQGWVHRAEDLRIITRDTARKLRRLIKHSGWQVQEPGPDYPRERPSRFERLVLRALAEELLTESKAAELLGQRVEELRRKRAMDGGDGTADRR